MSPTVPGLLGAREIEAALKDLEGWTLAEDGRTIAKSFRFRSFSEAFAFMTRAALAAERLNHHPDWSNSYNRVEVRLSTHSAKGVTELDVKLAKKMNEF
ncbi:MAG TPA: 4a-hydroxytetrahydrobiopterin dehydratase [Aestuariivirgaceae bacterium]